MANDQVISSGTIYSTHYPEMFRQMDSEYRSKWKERYQEWIDRYEGKNDWAVRVSKETYEQAKAGLEAITEIIDELDNDNNSK